MVSLSKKEAWLLIAGVVLVVALGVVWGVLAWRAGQRAALSPAERAISALLQQSKLPILSVVTSTPIPADRMPAFTRSLILPQATGTVVRATTYSGSKLGYQVTYWQTQSVQDAYGAFMVAAQKGGWSIVQGIRADGFAYLEFTGAGLSGRATFTSDAASTTKVVVSLAQS